MIFAACNKTETPVPPPPDEVVIRYTPKPIDKKSKVLLYQEKLQAIKDLSVALQQKKTVLQTTLAKFDAKITANVAEIKTEQSRAGITGFEQSMQQVSISHCLEAIQTAHAYKQSYTKHAQITEAGLVDLKGEEKQTELGVIYLEGLEEAKLDDLITDLNLVIDRVGPNAVESIVTEEDIDRQPLPDIYEQYIGREERGKERQRQVELEHQEESKQQLQEMPIIEPTLYKTIQGADAAVTRVLWAHSKPLVLLYGTSNDQRKLYIEDFSKDPPETTEIPIPVPAERAHKLHALYDVAWSPDDKTIAVLSGNCVDQTFRVWSVDQRDYTSVNVSLDYSGCTPQLLGWNKINIVIYGDSAGYNCHVNILSDTGERIGKHSFRASSTFWKDDHSFYYSKDGKVKLYDLNTGQETVEVNECPDKSDPNLFKTECSSVVVLQMLYERDRLVTFVQDKKGYRLSVWDTTTKEKINSMIKLVPDTQFWWWGDALVIVTGGEIYKLGSQKWELKKTSFFVTADISWSPRDPYVFLSPTTEVTGLAKKIAAAYGKYYIKDIESESTIAALLCNQRIAGEISWSPDGKHIIGLTNGWNYCLWNVTYSPPYSPPFTPPPQKPKEPEVEIETAPTTPPLEVTPVDPQLSSPRYVEVKIPEGSHCYCPIEATTVYIKKFDTCSKQTCLEHGIPLLNEKQYSEYLKYAKKSYTKDDYENNYSEMEPDDPNNRDYCTCPNESCDFARDASRTLPCSRKKCPKHHLPLTIMVY